MSVPPDILTPMLRKYTIINICYSSSYIVLNTHQTLSSMMPMLLLVLAACEAAVGLSLLVMVSKTYGVAYVQI